MAYVGQRVLPNNWAAQMVNRGPRGGVHPVRGLGLAPIPDSISGGIPAFPMPLPSVARFRTRRAEVRQAILPSYSVRSALDLPPVTSTALKPYGSVFPFPRSPIGISGLGAYAPANFKPFYESGGGCSCGMGDLQLPIVGDVDMKTMALMIGVLWIGSKLLSAGRSTGDRARTAARRVGVRSPVYRKAEIA